MQITYYQPVMKEVMEPQASSVEEYAEDVATSFLLDWQNELPYWYSLEGQKVRCLLETFVRDEVVYQVTTALEDEIWDADDIPDWVVRLTVGEYLTVYLAQEHSVPLAMELAQPLLREWGRDDEADELADLLRQREEL